MSALDDSSVLDPATPWAPKAPLAAAPAAPAPIASAAPPPASAGKITPETHPHYFSAPAAPQASTALGAPVARDDVIRRRESGGNDMAYNAATGASGRYQFLPSTWKSISAEHPELGLRPEDIWNGEKQDLAEKALTADNTRALEKTGLPVTPGNLYMLNFMGIGGGPKFLHAMQANPSADAATMFPLEAKYNPAVFFGKGGAPRSLGEVYGLMTKDFGGAGAAPLASASAPAATQASEADLPVPGATEAEEILPPLPAGAKPIEVAAPSLAMAPPLPPGAKSITPQEAYEQDVNKGAYEKEAGKDKVEEPGFWDAFSSPSKFFGPNASLSNLGGLIGKPEPGHENDFSKAVMNAESQIVQDNASFGLGAMSGAVQTPLGLAEDVPGPIGQGAAEANKWLQQIGAPEGQLAGEMGVGLIPAGRGLKAAASGVKDMIAEGPTVAKWAKGAIEGARGVGLAAAGDPTGETDPEKRAKEKLKFVGEGIASGAAVGTFAPAIGVVLKKIASLPATFRAAFGPEAEKAAEDLRRGVSAETGKAMTAEESRAKLATVEEGLKKTELAKHEAELGRVEKAQQGVAESERVRAEKGRDAVQAEDPEIAARLRADVSARVRERVRDAESAAERVGQNSEQARAFAEHQETRVKAAEESASKLAEDFAKRPTMPPEEFGKQLQDTAEKDAKALKAERAEKSGFEAAVNADKGKPSIPTKQFIAEINKAEPGMVSDAAKGALRKLRDDLRTETDGGRVTAVSIKTARRIVQDLDAKIEGLNQDEAHEITALKDRFVEHMEKVHPGLATAKKAYADFSRPLDVYRDSGPLTKTILEDPYSGKNIVDPTKIVGSLLNRTEGGADALGRLIKTNPPLQDAARRYFNQQLIDAAGAKGVPSEQQLHAFLTRNRQALDRSGLTQEFGGLKAAATTQNRIAEEAKRGVQTAAGAVKSADTVRSAALDKIASERSLSRAAAKREAEAGKNLTAPEDVAKSAASRAKEAEQRLKEQAKGPTSRKSETENSIRDLASSRAKAEAARRDFKEYQSSIDTLPAKGVAEAASSAVEKLHAKEHITDAQLDALNRQIQAVTKKYGDTAAARAELAKILIAGAGLGAASGYGIPLIRHTLPMH
jgi:hypothetical protein